MKKDNEQKNSETNPRKTLSGAEKGFIKDLLIAAYEPGISSEAETIEKVAIDLLRNDRIACLRSIAALLRIGSTGK